LIDNQDLRDVTLKSLRSVLGVVPQDPCLFNQTILENFPYSRQGATDEEVFDACKGAALHENIMSRPDGYNTKVGERGTHQELEGKESTLSSGSVGMGGKNRSRMAIKWQFGMAAKCFREIQGAIDFGYRNIIAHLCRVLQIHIKTVISM
jgi:hypothetical protein